MARVASCPQCEHELLVPSEADGEVWAKCPACRASFQVKQALSRDIPTVMLIGEEPADQAEIETQLDLNIDEELNAPVSRVDEPSIENELNADLDEAPAKIDLTADDDLDLQLDDLVDEPKKGDELEAAAQRIDEWFRSAKTVPDLPPVTDEGTTADESSDLLARDDLADLDLDNLSDATPADEELFVESEASTETNDDFVPAGSSRTNATIDLSDDDAEDLSAMADFDLGEPIESNAESKSGAAWDDSDRMEDLLNDIDPPSSDEFVAAVTQSHDDEMEVEPAMAIEERQEINMFNDDSAAPDVQPSANARPRRERSLVRTMLMSAAAGLLGLAAGYIALLWMRGPSIDFLNVAHYLPSAMLPSSFEDRPQTAQVSPPTVAPDATPGADSSIAETPTEPQEPQEFEPVTEEATQIADAGTAHTETALADADTQPAEVQAGYTETQPEATEPVADASAVGDRYATTSADTTDASTATGLTVEKPEAMDTHVDHPDSSDLTVNELTEDSLEEPSATAPDAQVESSFGYLPADDESGVELARLEASEPSRILTDPPSPLEEAMIESVTIAEAPTFSADDLRASLEAATKAQPQLVAGNFADGKDVQRAKGFGFSMLADLAQKATFFADDARSGAADLEKNADELFRKTLADAHTRGEVAQILPKWLASPNRKHGGVFFGGNIASHEQAGSVVECQVTLDGGQSLTVLTPAAAATVDSSKPMAIVGWVVDKPAQQVSGYTGNAPQAIYAEKLISLE